MLDISLIGTGGMRPLPNRFLTAMAARLNGRMLLIDCGEGTQVTLAELGWGVKNLDYICFTHYHADHIAGLPGLLLTIGNAGRTEPLTLVGPTGLQPVVQGLCMIAPQLPYALTFVEFPLEKQAFSFGAWNIAVLPLEHGQDCMGYSISLKRPGKFDIERAKQQGIPMEFWTRLQNGETIGTYSPDMVMGPERKGLKVSYITDTRPIEAIPEFIYGSDLFICEGIYGEDEKLEKAKEYKHMLFSEAATLAKEGAVGELWLTHFSPALTEPEAHIESAKNMFQNTKIGYDRMTKTFLWCE